ncbi:MAG: oligoribonuclease [Actinomycetales bacterium]|nr:oligoribonuclease [Actinomycetales bacterium]
MLAWMDLEMTGLEPDRHVIVEIATIITDDHLTIIAEGPDLVLGATEEQLSQMGDFVTQMHTKSGLLPAIRASTITMADAEQATLDFLREHISEPATVPLCGNSIGTDRRFLQHYMPELEAFFHYRNVDVSTLKELARRWHPDVLATMPEKETTHRALDDIRESIAELAHYRDQLFNRPVPDSSRNDG